MNNRKPVNKKTKAIKNKIAGFAYYTAAIFTIVLFLNYINNDQDINKSKIKTTDYAVATIDRYGERSTAFIISCTGKERSDIDNLIEFCASSPETCKEIISDTNCRIK